MQQYTLEYLLSLFSTEATKNNFLLLCKEYYGERLRQEAMNTAGGIAYNSKRAEIHNQIMEIVQKLFLRTQDIMPSRKEVGVMIMEYLSEQEL